MIDLYIYWRKKKKQTKKKLYDGEKNPAVSGGWKKKEDPYWDSLFFFSGVGEKYFWLMNVSRVEALYFINEDGNVCNLFINGDS